MGRAHKRPRPVERDMMLPPHDGKKQPTEQPIAAADAGSAAKKRHHLLRASWVSISIFLVCGIAIWQLSVPTTRRVYVTVALKEWTTPDWIELQFADVLQATFRDVDLTVDRVDELRGSGNGLPPPSLQRFRILDSDKTVSSSVRLTQGGRRGAFKVSVPPGSAVTATGGHESMALAIQIKPPVGSSIETSVEADTLSIDADRVSGGPLPIKGQSNTSQSFVASNAAVMASVSGSIRGEVQLKFKGKQVVSLLPAKGEIPASRRVLVMDDAAIQEASFRGAKDSEIVENFESKLEITSGGKFSVVEARAQPNDKGAAAGVLITAKGDVQSFRQDGTEMIPTRLKDLASADPTTRGLFGGGALLIAFVGGLLLKRAMDNLVKAVLPES